MIKLAWLHFRRSNQIIWFLILSLSLGFSGLVTVESVKKSIARKTQDNSKAFLSADLAISVRREFTENEKKVKETQLSEYEQSEVYEFFAMVSAPSGTKLVMVKAIDDQYPFYGEVEFKDHSVLNHQSDKSALRDHGAYVYADLENLLGFTVGEEFQLGELHLKVAGVVAKDSTQTFRAGGLAPRIFIHKNLLPESKLIQFGSTFTYSILLKLKNPPVNPQDELRVVETERKKLNDLFSDPAVQVATFQSAGADSARQLERLTDFMGLVSLVGIFLCALGAAYLMRVDLNQRLKEFAILKSLGMNRRKLYAYYFSFFSYLSVAVWIPTLLFAGISLFGLNMFIQKFSSVDLWVSMDMPTAILALLTVFAGNLLICFPHIESVHQVKAAHLFAEGSFQQNLVAAKWFHFLPALAIFCGLSVYQAQSWRIAGLFVLLLGLSILFLAGAGYVFIFSLLKKIRFHDWRLKNSIRSLERRRLQTLSVFVSLGLGVLLLNLLPQLKSNLMSELTVQEGSKIPSLFLFDIQEDQVKEFENFIQEHHQTISYLAPLVRSRLLKVNGESFERALQTDTFRTREEENDAQFRNRGINLSFRSELTPAESIVAGQFNGQVAAPESPFSELSVEERYAERMKIKMGDVLEFDVQGMGFKGKVTSLRSVRWTSFQPNFFILVQPGILNDVSKTYIASLSRMPDQERQFLQKELSAKFPNVSSVDIDRTILEILKVVDQMSLSLQLMSWICLVLGFVILTSMIRAQVKERFYELNMLKIFGARYDQIKVYLVFEFVLLSFAATFFGAVASMAVTLTLSHYLFEHLHGLDWVWPLISLVGMIFLTYVLSTLAAKRVMQEKPAALLK